MPARWALGQNYPNPFNPATVFSYQLAERSSVRLQVFDIFGREIATLVDGVQEAGPQSVRWDAGGLASGSYFYRLQAGVFTATRRLLLLK
jgi:hypothetical protein